VSKKLIYIAQIHGKKPFIALTEKQWSGVAKTCPVPTPLQSLHCQWDNGVGKLARVQGRAAPKFYTRNLKKKTIFLHRGN